MINLIPEGDLWRLIIRSKLPQAEQIEKWIMDEVLPAIRRTGSYSVTSPTCPAPKEKPYNYFDKFYKGEPVISLNDFSFFTGATRYRAYGMLMRCGKPETDYYTLEGSALADFKQENPKFPKAAVRWFIVITKSGFDKLIELMGFKAEAPKIFIEEKNQVCTAAVSKPSVDDYITALNVIRKIRNNAAEFMEDDIQKGTTFMIDSYTKYIEACKRVTKLLGISVATSC